MDWIFFLIGAVAVLAIAVVVVTTTTRQLKNQQKPAVYELPLALEWIAARLPDEVTARVSYDDVEMLLRWHLEWFQEIGVASRHGQELATEQARLDGVVATDEAAIDALVARSLAAGGPEAVDVVCVLDLQMKYLVAIGAVGSQTDNLDLPL